METLGNKIMPKNQNKFYCKYCDYGTSKKSSFTIIVCLQNIQKA